MIDIHTWSYPAIALAAAVEGEIVFVGAAALVGTGDLSAGAVAVAGTIGATLGDWFHYFAVRGRVSEWVRTGMPLAGQGALDWIRRHHTMSVAAIRFAPGFRIALTVLCAAAGVSPLRFCAVNAITAAVWAVAVLQAVAYGGPRLLTATGLSPVSATLVSALVALGLIAGAPGLLRRARSAMP